MATKLRNDLYKIEILLTEDNLTAIQQGIKIETEIHQIENAGQSADGSTLVFTDSDFIRNAVRDRLADHGIDMGNPPVRGGYHG